MIPAGSCYLVSDVVFVREELPSPEKVALAKKYQLPPSFYNYENKPPCPGCLGCYDDIEGKMAKGGYNLHVMCVMKKQTLRSLSLSYPKKDWWGPSPPIQSTNPSLGMTATMTC